jgi:hypothetical protein
MHIPQRYESMFHLEPIRLNAGLDLDDVALDDVALDDPAFDDPVFS